MNLPEGPTQNISIFNELDTQTRCVEIASAPPLYPERLAFKFLSSLDQVRHEAMFVRLIMNGRSAGGAFPNTIVVAYALTQEKKSASI